jgi:uncharacterized GH25 family protein
MSASAATTALAHQYWLAPTRYDAQPQQPVSVSAYAGTGFRGEAKPWSPGRCVRFVARTGKSIDLSRGASPGETAWARFAPADTGGALLAYESDFASIELKSDEFDAYLADEGLTGPLTARRKAGTHIAGRERYRRCAKTWLAGNDASRATATLGLPLEIVPFALPGSAASLRVRVLWSGSPLAGARVKVWRSPLTDAGAPLDAAVRDSVAMAWEANTDAHGELSVPCEKPGEWIVSTVSMQPSVDTSVADWESTWASLTFARLPKRRTGK